LKKKESSLIIPKKVENNISQIYYGNGFSVSISNETNESIIDKLTKICVKWNLNKTYESEEDQFDFIDEVYKTIFLTNKEVDIEYFSKLNNSLTNFLKFYKEEGKNVSLAFKPSEKFLSDFNIKKEKTIFKTHKNLDEFVIDLKAKNNTVKYEYPQVLIFFFLIYF
jgi:hypothetical protein